LRLSEVGEQPFTCLLCSALGEQLGFVPPCTEQVCIDNQVITNLLILYFRLKSSYRSKNSVGHLNKKIQLLDSQCFIIYMVGINHNCTRALAFYWCCFWAAAIKSFSSKIITVYLLNERPLTKRFKEQIQKKDEC
jgi:hypothetical protein